MCARLVQDATAEAHYYGAVKVVEKSLTVLLTTKAKVVIVVLANVFRRMMWQRLLLRVSS